MGAGQRAAASPGTALFQPPGTALFQPTDVANRLTLAAPIG